MKVKITTIIFFIITSSISFISCDSKSVKENSNANESLNEKVAGTEPTLMDSGNVKMVQPESTADITVKVFSSSINGVAGYGYDILIDGKPYVHQPHIPAVAGNRSFTSEKDARMAAELVAYKIRNNIMPPGVTVEELDSLGIK
jgi:Domain of unknown function (DUF4907)